MFGCPPVHTQQKHSMLCQTKGVAICPHTFGCPLYINNTKKACFVRLRGCPYAPYIWMPPVCMDAPCMFRYCHMFWMLPPVCLNTPVCLDAPICLDGTPVCLDAHICLNTPICSWMPSCMIGQPHVCTPPYVWMSPCMFGCSPICLDTARCMGTSKGMRDPQTCLDILLYGVHMDSPPYVTKHAPYMCWMLYSMIWGHLPNIHEGHPNIQGSSKHILGASKCMGCPYGQGSIQTSWGSDPKHVGLSKMCWVHPCTLQASKHIGGVQTYTGDIQTYGRVSTHIQGTSKYTGGCPNIQGSIQTYGGIQTYIGVIQTYGGIQTYRRVHPNIWGPSKHMGGYPNIQWQCIQTYGGI